MIKKAIKKFLKPIVKQLVEEEKSISEKEFTDKSLQLFAETLSRRLREIE